MISFLLCLAILIVGYFVYGKIVDNTFGPDDRETPAVRINDGVDYVVMPQWKLFLVQLLNIAGLGPIFGALQGALWGPVVFLWITFGTIFAGGVHDYFSGMMSERNDGASIAEVTGRYLGPVMQNIMRVFSVVLLIMVGTVFAVGPAGLIVTLCKNSGMSGLLTTTLFWLIIILVYYFIATFISIDAIIGKIYPVFGICLIIMAVGVIFGIFTNPAYTIPEIWANFSNMHPSGTPIWSFMFITVACGAISGFHSTQSPLMARCMKSEKQGHFVFYGAMVCEGVIALIWAAAGCALYTITDGKMAGLAEALAAGQSAAIYDVCAKTMGGVGIALAMIGVVICPITSGDTAFRSARLTLADWLKIDQDSYANRLKLCVPVLGVGAFLGIGNALGFINYTVIWRYFSWTNQTLAMIVLWALSASDYKEKFVLKGGMLVAAIVGLDNRATMDMDTTLKNLPLTPEAIRSALEDICDIAFDDGVVFEIRTISPIREDDIYGGYRVMLNAKLDTLLTPLSIDVSAGDAITPHAVQYNFFEIFDDGQSYELWAYNIETVMAEKVETILRRGVFNTRPRDFYDAYILTTTQKFDKAVFAEALRATADHRSTTQRIADVPAILHDIEESPELQIMWNKYRRQFSYAKEIEYISIITGLRQLLL